MSLTLADVIEHLKKLDETTLLEVLDLSAEDIVDRFPDKIEERLDYLLEDLEDDDEENED